MLAKIRSKLSFANVAAMTALFIALGGSAYAATELPPDSVNSKQIVNGGVRPVDIGPVQPWQEPELGRCVLGTYGAESLWQHPGGSDSRTAFFRDPFKVVHVKGTVRCGATGAYTQDPQPIFRLPRGYRPDEVETFAAAANAERASASIPYLHVTVAPDGYVRVEDPEGEGRAFGVNALHLDGITFRAG